VRKGERRFARIALAAGMGLAALVRSGLAQPPPAAPEVTPPTFGREVELVRVDVVVTDKSGRPVRGLSREDFSLLEEGKPQAIETFESLEFALPPPSAEPVRRPRIATNEAPPPSDPSRSCVVVVDTLNLVPASAARAKAAVALFLDQGVRPGDRVTLIATGGGAWWSARVPEGRAELLTVLKSLEGRRIKTDMRDAITDYEAMRIHVHNDSQVAYRVQRRFETYGVTSRVESARERERRETYLPGVNDPYVERRAAEEYLKIRTRNRVSLGAIERALRPLAATKERKSVLLVSDGFIFDTQEDGFKTITEAARRANAVLYFLDTRGLVAPSLYSAQFGALPGDPGAVTAVLADSSQDAEGAEFLAQETGGFSVRNTNDLTDGVERIAQEARSYYLLGYTPGGPRDGRFRRLEVKVRGRDLRVRARRGYYAPSDIPAVAKSADGKDTDFQEALDAAAFQDAIPLRLTALVLGDGEPGKARVLVAAEADVAGLGFEEKEGKLVGGLELLMVVAQARSGEFSRYDERIDLARQPGPPPTGAKWHSIARELNLAPGSYQVKLVVRDPLTRRLGSLAFDFEVPAVGGLRVSTPVLTDTLQQSAAGVGPVVVARRSFAAGFPLYCRFDVYGMAKDPGGQPRVSAGHVLRRTDGTVVSRSAPTRILPTSLGAVARLMQIPLDLDPGDYELVLTVRDEVAGLTQELVEPFAVVASL
jgi:VWFA-related protein